MNELSTLAWYPAAEFLEFERINKAYSFDVPAFSVDTSTTDGPKYTQIMNALSEQLQQHVAKANLLISLNEKIPQFDVEVEEMMRIAIGRTQLLLNKRMKQFREHLSRHLKPIPGQKVTKLNDLHALWVLIDMQLDDIRSIFNSIEQFRLRCWAVAEPKAAATAASSGN
ncbi:hypothetical protein niasHS_007165 [Heterodera schachtii]|uniref:Uncharacterized protein n=1 Tax=Heterodera schachtii TaxID=97005 RepID=A0ABD2JLE2_HETSC